MINGHGNNLYDYGEIVADFSSNIAFNNQSSEIIAHLATRLDCITNYPDPSARALTSKLAVHHEVDTSQILVTNGSAEAFYLIAHLFQGGRTAICTPSFAEYEDACRLFNHSLTFHPIANLEQLNCNSFDTVWFGTPNNPDGTLTDITKIGDNTTFVVDRAYSDLTIDSSQIVNHTAPNLISTHSLTKAFAIPGLRLGYIIASADVITQLSAMRAPWGVNALSLAAGEYIIDNYDRLLPSIDELIGESQFLQKSLADISNIEVTASTCNFFLSRLKNGTATELKERLVTEHGILIRDCSNFRGLDSSYFRVSAQTRDKNMALINALKA